MAKYALEARANKGSSTRLYFNNLLEVALHVKRNGADHYRHPFNPGIVCSSPVTRGLTRNKLECWAYSVTCYNGNVIHYWIVPI